MHMKLIHCADLHLESALTRHFSPEKARERRAELLHNFARLADRAEELSVSGILIAGDLFDRPSAGAAAGSIVLDTVRSHPDILFYYLRGNHDPGAAEGPSGIPENLKLFGPEWVSYPAGREGRVVITGAEAVPGMEQRLWNTLSLEPGNINIVLLHGQETEYGKGKDASFIDLRALRGRNIDYLALGHIHGHREGRLDPRGVFCYPGCLEGRGFDECGEHGFELLTIDEERRTLRTEFVPFAKRRILRVPADISGCRSTAQAGACLREALSKAAPDPGSMVLAVLKGEVPAEALIDVLFLEKQFGENYYLFRLEDESSVFVDYSAYAYDESLKGEFVRTARDADLSGEDRAEVVRLGLRALRGEELL